MGPILHDVIARCFFQQALQLFVKCLFCWPDSRLRHRQVLDVMAAGGVDGDDETYEWLANAAVRGVDFVTVSSVFCSYMRSALLLLLCLAGSPAAVRWCASPPRLVRLRNRMICMALRTCIRLHQCTPDKVRSTLNCVYYYIALGTVYCEASRRGRRGWDKCRTMPVVQRPYDTYSGRFSSQ